MHMPLHGRSILVADDEDSIRTLLQDMLEPDGATVYLARNGPEALAIIHDHALDLAILDIQMPEPGGLAILRRLRQQGNSLPVLIITAHRLSRRDVQDMQSSATSYIAKPFDPTWMLQTIQRTLQQHA